MRDGKNRTVILDNSKDLEIVVNFFFFKFDFNFEASAFSQWYLL